MKVFGLTKQDLFVIQQLAHKDKSRENASSFMGQFWQILNPFINMIVLILVFSTMFANKDFVNYPMFVATGTMIFELFNFGTRNSLGALVSNKNFLIKTQIDKRLYIMERVYVAIINFTYSFVIYLGLMIFFHIPFRWTMMLLIPDIILLLLLIYGMGKILAVINVLFADITYFYQIFTLFLFYGSALFYSPAKIAGSARDIITFNPVYVAVAIARIAIIDGKIPGVGLWIKLFVYSSVIFLIGKKVFENSVENIVAKI
ncbi:ABC-2 type transport system permease protein [Lachnospiraceae bacterium A10]|nr:ABC-2 type transport system permease protein [Lachnospiraceae bacterium A10]